MRLTQNPHTDLSDTRKYENMKTTTQFDNSIYQSTVRAEDGRQQLTRWSSFCEGVLLPLGSLFAVFLVMLGIMLIVD